MPSLLLTLPPLSLVADLKPDNFLLGADGYVKLTDFGISSFVDPSSLVCVDSSGTKGYMAPEVYRKGHKHNHTAEIFR